MRTSRSGLAAAIGAFVLWGLFPLYFPLLKPAMPIEILSHRVLWSFVLLALVGAVVGGFAWVRRISRRQFRLLLVAAALITVNWGVFIYGVNSHRVVETSLGYFINPLVLVALGVFVLGEELRRPQLIAVAIAALGVLVLTIQYGHPPWIALTLALTFGTYGLVKKKAGVDGIQSLTIETAVLLPLALVYLLIIEANGTGSFASHGTGHALLLVSAGLTTALPLVLFGAATQRIPLTMVGLLNYITPTMQFMVGVLVDHEPLPALRLGGFVLVWLALVLFSVDAVRSARGSRAPREAAGTAAAPALR